MSPRSSPPRPPLLPSSPPTQPPPPPLPSAASAGPPPSAANNHHRDHQDRGDEVNQPQKCRQHHRLHYPVQINEPLHASVGHPYYRQLAGPAAAAAAAAATAAAAAPHSSLSTRPQSASSFDSGYSTAPAIMDQGAPPPTSAAAAAAASSAAAAAAAAAAATPSSSSNHADHRQMPGQPLSGPQSIPISSLISHEHPPAVPITTMAAMAARQRPACIPCRRKKVGCDLRREDSGGPPCLRCQHEKQECVVPPVENTLENPSPQELPSIKDLACPHCSLVFLRDHDLRAHLRTQCQEKHYVCPTCQARFRRLNDLDRHLRIHTGERPHVCDICGRRFSRATTLSRHRQGPDGCAGRRADLGKRRFDRPPGGLGQGQHVIQQRLPTDAHPESTPPA